MGKCIVKIVWTLGAIDLIQYTKIAVVVSLLGCYSYQISMLSFFHDSSSHMIARFRACQFNVGGDFGNFWTDFSLSLEITT